MSHAVRSNIGSPGGFLWSTQTAAGRLKKETTSFLPPLWGPQSDHSCLLPAFDLNVTKTKDSIIHFRENIEPKLSFRHGEEVQTVRTSTYQGTVWCFQTYLSGFYWTGFTVEVCSEVTGVQLKELCSIWTSSVPVNLFWSPQGGALMRRQTVTPILLFQVVVFEAAAGCRVLIQAVVLNWENWEGSQADLHIQHK